MIVPFSVVLISVHTNDFPPLPFHCKVSLKTAVLVDTLGILTSIAQPVKGFSNYQKSQTFLHPKIYLLKEYTEMPYFKIY